MIVRDLSEASVLAGMQKHLNEVESQRTRDRHMMMSYYESMVSVMEDDMREYFDSASLKQTPLITEGLTRKLVNARAVVYKQSPERECDERYFDYFDDLDSSMLQMERLTYLLGTNAMRVRFNQDEQKLEWLPISEFYPIFESYNENPSGVIYPLFSYGSNAYSAKEDQMFAYWSDDQHYRINGKGQIVDSPDNPDRINPYGVMPILFAHRHFLSTDWFREGCSEIVQMNKAVNVMLSEVNLALRLTTLGQPTITNTDSIENLKFGADKPIILSSGELEFKTSGVDLQKVVEVIRFMVDSVAYNHNLKTKWSVGRESAISGESLKMAEIDLTESLVTDANMIWRPFEKKRFNIDRAVIEYETGVKLDDAYSVDFTERRFPLSAEEERQQWEWEWTHGLKSKKDYFRYMDKDNIEEDQIDETIARIEEEGTPAKPDQKQQAPAFSLQKAFGNGNT